MVIANSRGPETLADLVSELGENARAATAAEAAAAGDVVVVTVPFKAYESIPVEPLAGKIVIDTNNYYFERDGHIAALNEGSATVTGMLQEDLPTSRVAKGFNHIPAPEITTDGEPAGTPDRRALATASDHDDAVQLVTDLYDQFGFDTVNVGPLSESWRIERDQPTYVVRQNREELVANAAKAQRIVAAEQPHPAGTPRSPPTVQPRTATWLAAQQRRRIRQVHNARRPPLLSPPRF